MNTGRNNPNVPNRPTRTYEFDAARFAQLQPNGGGTEDEISRITPNFALRRFGVLAVAMLTILGVEQVVSTPSEACVVTPGAATIQDNKQETADLLRQHGIDFNDLGKLDNVVVDQYPGNSVCLVEPGGTLGKAKDFLFPTEATNTPTLTK